MEHFDPFSRKNIRVRKNKITDETVGRVDVEVVAFQLDRSLVELLQNEERHFEGLPVRSFLVLQCKI